MTALRVTIATFLPLTQNEPYYWLWATHPALGYYDHPPLMAWLSMPLVPLGVSPLVVRTPALACSTLCAVLMYLYARRLTRDEGAATVAGLALLAAPYYTVMSVLAWPESALLATWAWTLLAWQRAIFDEGAAGPGGRWLQAGVALGCCLLAKFTSFALLFGLALFFVVSPVARGRWLRTPWPWMALLAAVVVYSPFLYWNSQHEWQTFLFQAKERGSEPVTFYPLNVFKLLAEALGGLSPIIGVAMVAAIRDAGRRAVAPVAGEPWRLALLVALPAPLAFLLVSPFKLVQLYWMLCCFLALFPLLGAWYAARVRGAEGTRWRRWAVIAVAVAIFPLFVMGGAVLTPRLLFSLAGRPQGSGLTEMYGYPELPAVLEEEARKTPHPDQVFFAAEDHRLASQLALRQPRPVLMFGYSMRGKEYLRWQRPGNEAGRSCIMLLRQPFDEKRALLKIFLDQIFDEVGRPVQHVVTWNGLPTQTYYTVVCRGFHPERFPDDFTAVRAQDLPPGFIAPRPGVAP